MTSKQGNARLCVCVCVSVDVGVCVEKTRKNNRLHCTWEVIIQAISYLSPLRDKNYPHKRVCFCFFEEPITQHPPDVHTQIHTQCEDRMGLDSI